MTRIDTWTSDVKCTTPDCDDRGVLRQITIPNLGDGVFLMPTTLSPLGLTVFNLWCGTCKQTRMVQA